MQNVQTYEGGYDKYAPLIGRILMSAIFILSGISKITGWNSTLHMMQGKGIPFTEAALAVSLAVEILAGLAILVGYRTRLAAGILFLYLVPVTLIMHNFWDAPAATHMMQQINFMKNLAIMGGLLLLSVFGPGVVSLDSKDRWSMPSYMRREVEAPR